MTILKRIFQNNLSNFSLNFKVLSAGITFLSSIIYAKMLNINNPRGPLFIPWLPTYRCNVNCNFCSTHELNKRYPESLDKKRALEIAHQIGRHKTWMVGFTGGEPLLWPHLFDVIKVLKKYNVNVYIITNGLLLKKMARQIIDSGADSITISLDSHIPSEHDNNRNRPGLFKAAIEGIEEIKRLRKKRPIIKSTTVFSKMNYSQIKETIDCLSKIVDEFSIQPICTGYANHPHQIDKNKEDSFIPKTDEEIKLTKALDGLKKTYLSFDNFYLNNIPNYLFHTEKLLDIRCWSPFLRLSILPQGETTHCLANPRYPSTGNLREMNLMDAWNSPAMKKYREEIRRGKNKCICWSRDSSFNAFLHTIPLINKLPIFRKR